MKIWQITIGTEKSGGNITVFNGTASTAQKAIIEAKKLAEDAGYKGVYCSKVNEIGEEEFRAE